MSLSYLNVRYVLGGVIAGTLLSALCWYTVFPFIQSFFHTTAKSYEAVLEGRESYQDFFAKRPPFEILVEFFEDLARAKGAEFAFDVLINEELPPGVDSHLVGHSVGNILYEQQGLEGLKHCTPDLTYACAHSVVISALLTEGMSVFDRIHSICQTVNGPGAYDMCFHGFGHAVLGYTLYEMPEAVELCNRVGTESYNGREVDECVGGAVMEMVSGIHDPRVWAEKKDKYLIKDDPTSLCRQDYLTSGGREMCYIYITPVIFTYAGAGNYPINSDYKRSFEVCSKVKDVNDKRACYRGIGKEIPPLVHGRDVTKISDSTDQDYQLMISRCLLAENEFGITACNNAAISGLYRGGLYPFTTPERFCALMTEAPYRNSCYRDLINYVNNNPVGRDQMPEFCAYIPKTYQTQCLAGVRDNKNSLWIDVSS